MKQKIILASSSKYRKKLLKRILKNFKSISPNVDEASFHVTGLSPISLAETLAKEKALAIQKNHKDAIVIGSDQVVNLNGKVFGKPKTKQNACAQLENMSGQAHELITAVCVIFQEQTFLHTDITRMYMKKLSHDSLQRYVDQDLPLDCAGSYKIESLGISLFDKIETGDPTAIEGLPLTAVTRILGELGIRIP